MFARKARRVTRQTVYTVNATNARAPYKTLAKLRDTFTDQKDALAYARTLKRYGYAVVITRTSTERLLP